MKYKADYSTDTTNTITNNTRTPRSLSQFPLSLVKRLFSMRKGVVECHIRKFDSRKFDHIFLFDFCSEEQEPNRLKELKHQVSILFYFHVADLGFGSLFIILHQRFLPGALGRTPQHMFHLRDLREKNFKMA